MWVPGINSGCQARLGKHLSSLSHLTGPQFSYSMHSEAGEVAVWFRILAAVPEDQSLAPSTHTEVFTPACNSSPRDQTPSFGPWILMCKFTYRHVNNEVFVKRKSV